MFGPAKVAPGPVRRVLANGTPVREDGALVANAKPGQVVRPALRSEVRARA